MSQFDQQLSDAKKKQRRIYAAGIVAIIVCIILIISVMISTRATRIDVMPEEAGTQATIQVGAGMAIIAGRILYSLSGNPVISVSSEGFKTKEQQLADGDFGKVLSIELDPLPSTIKLRPETVHERTGWYINGELVTFAGELNQEVEAGDYTISIQHPYFKEKTLDISLERGEIYERTVSLEPLTGQLVLNTTPSGATVKIGQETIGVTPLTKTLQGGRYDILVTMEKYKPIDETIEIISAKPDVIRNYNLELKKGSVNVIYAPAGGKLVLDNMIHKPVTMLEVEVGIPHTLTYSKPGYFPQTRTFTVSDGETHHLSFNLEKERGEVRINSSPVADVLVNGEYMGTTPVQLMLDALPQRVDISKKGYRTVTRQITPDSHQAQVIDISLLTEKAARLAEAPATYRHKAGGKLKLFRPNETFLMGAERGEPGQRANEFLKTIVLSKAFYAGVHEVTNSIYQQFDSSVNGAPGLPVTGITWIEAAEFCNWLSQEENLINVYSLQGGKLVDVNKHADGYRLLTEAEWEWLARKANRAHRTRFVWGDNTVIPKNAVNIADESAKGQVEVFVPKYNDGYAGLAPAGSFQEEKSGLFDLGGNVREWTHDSYSLVPPGDDEVFQDPFDTSLSNSRVIRGASWRSGSLTELRSSYREGTSKAPDDVGFRIGRYVYGD
jgi:formylglycine-generating enzyme required for sulfatase activity